MKYIKAFPLFTDDKLIDDKQSLYARCCEVCYVLYKWWLVWHLLPSTWKERIRFITTVLCPPKKLIGNERHIHQYLFCIQRKSFPWLVPVRIAHLHIRYTIFESEKWEPWMESAEMKATTVLGCVNVWCMSSYQLLLNPSALLSTSLINDWCLW